MLRRVTLYKQIWKGELLKVLYRASHFKLKMAIKPGLWSPVNCEVF